MPNWIEHTCEPKRLILAWQAPDALQNRRRFAVGELLRQGSEASLRYFENDCLAEAKALGFSGYPAFKLDRREHKDVLATFMRRLPPRSRSDFREYMAHFRLGSTAPLSDFALLAYTEAKLPSDGFSIVNDLQDVEPPCEFLIEIAGFRHHPNAIGSVQPGEMVELVPEPENQWDSDAIAVRCQELTVGYVNRLQTAAFHRWIEQRSVVAAIERLNGTPSKPRAFMFVWVTQPRGRAAA